MSGKGFEYWNNMWDNASSVREQTLIYEAETESGANALHLLHAYGQQLFTSYGNDVERSLDQNGPMMPTRYYDINDVLERVQVALGTRPLYRNGDLYHILQVIDRNTGSNFLTKFECRNKPSVWASFFTCQPTPPVTHTPIAKTVPFTFMATSSISKVGGEFMEQHFDWTMVAIKKLEEVLSDGFLYMTKMTAGLTGDFPVTDTLRGEIAARIGYLKDQNIASVKPVIVDKDEETNSLLPSKSN